VVVKNKKVVDCESKAGLFLARRSTGRLNCGHYRTPRQKLLWTVAATEPVANALTEMKSAEGKQW